MNRIYRSNINPDLFYSDKTVILPLRFEKSLGGRIVIFFKVIVNGGFKGVK